MELVLGFILVVVEAWVLYTGTELSHGVTCESLTCSKIFWILYAAVLHLNHSCEHIHIMCIYYHILTGNSPLDRFGLDVLDSIIRVWLSCMPQLQGKC